MNTINTSLKNSHNMYFTSNKKSGQSYSEFKRFDAESNFAAQIKKVILDKNNYISEGVMNEVYAIPNNENFVIRVLKTKKEKFLRHATPKLKEIKDRFKDINIGQPIATYGDGIQVLIKQNGKPHGLFHLLKDENVKSGKDLYIQKVKQLASIPQRNYSKLTDEIKEIRKKGFYMDVWNANNLLIDGNNMNIVDTTHFYNLYYKFVNRVTKKNMLRILVDEKGLNRILPYLSDADKVGLGKSIAIISDKLSAAMKHSEISEFKEFDTFIAKLRDAVLPRKQIRIEKLLAGFIKLAKG